VTAMAWRDRIEDKGSSQPEEILMESSLRDDINSVLISRCHIAEPAVFLLGGHTEGAPAGPPEDKPRYG
jgi:hypothetical protein